MSANTQPSAPPLELISHDVYNDSESDLYGVKHDLGYERGDIEDPANYFMYAASWTVGGLLYGEAKDEGIAEYSVRQIFPPNDNPIIRGIHVSGEPLDEAQVAAFSAAKIQDLTLRNKATSKAVGQ